MNVAARNKNANKNKNKNKNKNVQSMAAQSAKAENAESNAQSQGINDGDLFGTFPTKQYSFKSWVSLQWDLFLSTRVSYKHFIYILIT